MNKKHTAEYNDSMLHIQNCMLSSIEDTYKTYVNDLLLANSNIVAYNTMIALQKCDKNSCSNCYLDSFNICDRM